MYMIGVWSHDYQAAYLRHRYIASRRNQVIVCGEILRVNCEPALKQQFSIVITVLIEVGGCLREQVRSGILVCSRNVNLLICQMGGIRIA